MMRSAWRMSASGSDVAALFIMRESDNRESIISEYIERERIMNDGIR